MIHVPHSSEGDPQEGKKSEIVSDEDQSALDSVSGNQRTELAANFEQMSLGEFMEGVVSREHALRKRLRDETPKRMKTAMSVTDGSTYTGNAFIEDLGVVREFENGICEFLYNEQAVQMRAASLEPVIGDRMAFFDDITQGFPEKSRILSIGSAFDTAPLRSYLKGGHEVIATDAGNNIMKMLQERAGVPTFACDLIHLNEVVPSQSVDIITGNSTLAYLDPRKSKQIVAHLVSIMRKGGVFTFDLSPHPSYFRIAEEKDRVTAANEGEPDPLKVIELVEQYGPLEGIAATMYYYAIRYHATQLGTLAWLQDLFKQHGLQTQLSSKPMRHGGPQKDVTILRAVKDPALLACTPDEEPFVIDADYWDQYDPDKVLIQFVGIDRESGSRLAKLFGIKATKTEAPWLVAPHFVQNYDPETLQPQTRQAIKVFFNPLAIRERMQCVSDGGPFTIGLKMDYAVATDQTVHKQVLTGVMFRELPPEMAYFMADKAIDAEYAKKGGGGSEISQSSFKAPKKKLKLKLGSKPKDKKQKPKRH